MEKYKIMLGVSTLNKTISLTIDYDNQSAELNGEKFDLQIKSFVRDLTRIVSGWKNEMKDNTINDGLSYFVHIKKDGKVYKFDGLNKFPDNFDEFMLLLEEAKVW